MKTIELKTVEMPTDDGKTINLSYRMQLYEIMRTPPEGKGADYDDIRRSLRIMDLLDKPGEAITLDEADFEYMKKRVLAIRWPMINKAVAQFIEDVTNPQ
jgi:hypothetical protein